MLADNQLAITGSGWDPELLRLELGELNIRGAGEPERLRGPQHDVTTLPTALAPIGLMTVPVAIRWVVPLIDRPA